MNNTKLSIRALSGVAGAILVLLFKDRKLLDSHPYHGWRQRKHASRAWHSIDRRRR